ncbi:MAG: hypothetical protein H6721_25060 [Sandaracinus sp.]|nr:hypothetical protein [Myxococcales bacterium]MCB9611635.1 hypothetical protein [Sandaracinus sp.]MCB9618849.1 hypothetical protein [Sandaracinus sp.]MCB9623299.1 hypothetical protein [Sandaracinus sp.]MCB9635403.1 hypothetical protein [Sandaracinus sp.]
MRRSLLISVLLSLVACGSDTVELQLAFPSSDAFVRSSNAQLFVVDVAEDLGACPDLLMEAELGTLEGDVHESDVISVCDVSVGRLRVPDVSEGVHAFVATAISESGQVLLAGCAIADPYVDSGALTIVMYPTERYRTTFPAGTPAEECSVEQKCQLGCR